SGLAGAGTVKPHPTHSDTGGSGCSRIRARQPHSRACTTGGTAIPPPRRIAPGPSRGTGGRPGSTPPPSRPRPAPRPKGLRVFFTGAPSWVGSRRRGRLVPAAGTPVSRSPLWLPLTVVVRQRTAGHHELHTVGLNSSFIA